MIYKCIFSTCEIYSIRLSVYLKFTTTDTIYEKQKKSTFYIKKNSETDLLINTNTIKEIVSFNTIRLRFSHVSNISIFIIYNQDVLNFYILIKINLKEIEKQTKQHYKLKNKEVAQNLIYFLTPITMKIVC